MVSKVAVVGAGGNIGAPIVQQLIAEGFNVTILSRSDKPSNVPAGTTVRKVDYGSVESLTAALQGIDAVVATVAFTALAQQKIIIDAAAAAGVKRFLPSEFGLVVEDPKFRNAPLFGEKIEVSDYLKKVSAQSGLSYTLVSTGAFLDWGLQVGFIVGNFKGRQAEVMDDGDVLFSATTLATIGKGVASILRHPEETKNKTIYIQDAVVTQSKLVAIAKELTPGAEWSVTRASSAELKAKADANIAKGVFDQETASYYLRSLLWGKQTDIPVVPGKSDNELLGIKELSNEELRAVVKTAL